MADREVLQDFLARLGFEVHQPSMRAFFSALKLNCLGAAKLTAGIVGVGVAAETMAYLFAKNSEKLYYSSQRVRASAANIQALEYGTKQIGINSDEIKASLEGLAATLRLNPASGGLLEMLGITSEGRDRVEVLLDTVQALKSQFTGDQYFVGASFAKSLALYVRTFLMMSDRLDELRQFYADRKKMSEQANVDPDRAAAAGREYILTLNQLWEKIGLLGDKFKINLLDPFREVNKELSEIISQFTNWLGSDEGSAAINSMVIHMRVASGVMTDTLKSLAALRRGDLAAFNELDKRAFGSLMYLLDPTGMVDVPAHIQELLNKSGRGKGSMDVSIPGRLDFTDPLHARNRPVDLPSSMGDLSGHQLQQLEFLTGQLREHQWSPYNQFRIGNEIDAILGQNVPKLGATLGDGSGRSVQINATSHVTVTGAAQPEVTAAAVERANSRVFGELARNLGMNAQ